MALLNRSRPISGIVAVVGALVGVPSLGVLVHTEWQKLRTYTSEVAACENAEYQYQRVSREVTEKDHAYLDYDESSLFGQLKKEKLRWDFYLGSCRFAKGGDGRALSDKYIAACSISVVEEKINYDYYVSSAPYWAFVAFPALAVAGIGLTLNRRKEE